MIHLVQHNPPKLARRARAVAFGVALSAGALAAGALVQGCGTEGDSTGGKRVVLHTRMEMDPAAKEPFTTAFGWKVTLDQAVLSVGPLYYFDGAPPLVFRSPRRPSASELAARWLGLGTAHAHPGHYQAGNALGEMLEGTTVDLFTTPVELADGDGVTGTYRSARFTFLAPPEGALAKTLGDHVALASGTAEKDGEETRHFRATADLADVEKSAAEGHVEGCELTEVEVESDGTVTVVVHPQVWFDLVDFTEIEPGTTEAPSTFPADSQPAIAFAQGLAQLSAYKFSYLPD